ERARLVLSERLGRVEVERTRVPVGGQSVEHRQVEGERLARRGTGRDNDVAAVSCRRVRLGLMGVELVDTAARECFLKGSLKSVRKRRGSCLACGFGREMRQLFADQKVVPGSDGGHATIQAV